MTWRWVILGLTWTVLLLRSPALRRPGEGRWLWWTLLMFGLGSILIQPWFGSAINAATGITEFNNLCQTLWGLLSQTTTLEFAVAFTGARVGTLRTRLGLAALTVCAVCVLFFASPVETLFHADGTIHLFTVYALTSATYLLPSAAITSWLLFSRLGKLPTGFLRTNILLIGIGELTQFPFMIIRTAQRIVPNLSDFWLTVGFQSSVIRFLLMPIGFSLIALTPIARTARWLYHRARLYPLWASLRAATPELGSAETPGRLADLAAVDRPEERLQERVTEIQHGIRYLRHCWGWPQLEREAEVQADRTPTYDAHALATACWLETTRRLALRRPVKLCQDEESGGDTILDDLLGTSARIIRVSDALTTPIVDDFASSIVRAREDDERPRRVRE